MITLRFIVPRFVQVGKSAAAALLLAAIAADASAQTSVALSPPLPPKDVFQQLEHYPDRLTRPEPVPVGTVPVAVVDLTRIVLKRKGEADWTRNYITVAAAQYLNIGRVPFGVYLLTFCPTDFRRSEAVTYRRQIAEVLGKIDASLIPVSDRPRQRQILQASDEMLARSKPAWRCPATRSRDSRGAWGRSSAPTSMPWQSSSDPRSKLPHPRCAASSSPVNGIDYGSSSAATTFFMLPRKDMPTSSSFLVREQEIASPSSRRTGPRLFFSGRVPLPAPSSAQ